MFYNEIDGWSDVALFDGVQAAQYCTVRKDGRGRGLVWHSERRTDDMNLDLNNSIQELLQDR